jgi:8-oxo-dGTP pyrophosphatase MutT (NUDIX family)
MTLPIVVRAFLFNNEGNILLAKHTRDTPWVLPGGHLENTENIHDAIKREILEEFGLEAQFFDIDREETLFHKWQKLTHLPLPISIYELHYTGKDGKDKSRIEYVFLMETSDAIKNVQTSEIYEYKWFDADDILIMEPNKEVYDFTLEMLEKIIGNDDNNE